LVKSMAAQDSPTLSVVMSVYNGLPYLNQAVEGILNQTFTDFEFIIIDDGSVDPTWSVLTAFAELDSRIVLLQNEGNIGYTRSLMRGMEQAKGVYIARQDADDISLPERFEKQLLFLEMHPDVGLLGTARSFIDGQGNPLDYPKDPLIYDSEELYRRMIHQNYITHGSVMIRKSCLDLVGTYDPQLEPAEDYDLWLRLGEVTHLFVLADVLYIYRVHSNSVSKKREYEQVLHKADALSKAMKRRQGSDVEMNLVETTGRDYFRAAMIAYSGKLVDQARSSLHQSLELLSHKIECEQLIEKWIDWYSPAGSIDEKHNIIEGVFRELFPVSKAYNRLRRRIISNLHMREVFALVNNGQWQGVKENLLTAIRFQPAWLINKGVISILFRVLLIKDRKLNHG
jgi:glycosyltransferase involved in cell wall biosynthesis